MILRTPRVGFRQEFFQKSESLPSLPSDATSASVRCSTFWGGIRQENAKQNAFSAMVVYRLAALVPPRVARGKKRHAMYRRKTTRGGDRPTTRSDGDSSSRSWVSHKSNHHNGTTDVPNERKTLLLSLPPRHGAGGLYRTCICLPVSLRVEPASESHMAWHRASCCSRRSSPMPPRT